jgi:hypothetical protein
MTKLLDGLRFRRVMAGEYRADTAGGTYHVWRYDDGWVVTFSPEYRVTVRLGYHRTMTAGRIAAGTHAIAAGIVKAPAS